MGSQPRRPDALHHHQRLPSRSFGYAGHDDADCHHDLDIYLCQGVALCLDCLDSSDLPATWSHRGPTKLQEFSNAESGYRTLLRFYEAFLPYWVEYDDDVDYG